MSNSISVPVITGQITRTGQNQFNETSTALDVNGFLFDVSFTVPEDYTGGWDFLRDISAGITLRIGSGVGGQVSLVNNVPLYDIMMYSDYIAGVSMKSTTFTAGEKVRMSGYLDIGFFSMGSRDALEVSIMVTNTISHNVNFKVSAIYNRASVNLLQSYTVAKPLGADSPYTNVLGLYYCGTDTEVNEAVTVRDDIGDKYVNVEDCIARSNAIGNFEYFTRFGELWCDTYGFSQDVTFRVPAVDANARILIKRVEFNNAMLIGNAKDMTAERAALIEKIKNKDFEKYEYLKNRGLL